MHGVVLDVLLIVLKVIGILSLCILGLFIVVALIVLFVPVRYKSYGEFNKTEDGLEHKVYAKATWFLHIVSIGFQRVDNDNKLMFKIFGFDLLNKKEKKKRVKKKDLKKDLKTEKQTTVVIQQPIVMEKNENIVNKQIILDDTSNRVNKTKVVKEKDKKEKINKEPLVLRIKTKIISFITKLKELCEKVKYINNVKDSFITYLKKDTSKKAIKKIKKMVFKVFKHILPRKLKATIGFGFEDPSTTGNVLGMSSIFYGIYGDNLELEPDFDNQVLYGKYALKGHIRMFPLVIIALRLYFNKWIREFVTFSQETIKDL